jgi:prolipoprotein diacylglyceryltransferase
LYLVAYGVLRAIVELYRGDYPPGNLYWNRITPAHWVSFGLIAAGIALYVVRRRQGSARVDRTTPVQ